MLTIKILFTINSLKKNYSVKTLFTITFVQKKLLVLIRKNSFNLKKINGNLIDNKAHYKILFTIYFA